MPSEETKFFLSYARKDGQFALKLAKELRAAGANLWVDQLDIRAGDEWDTAVEEALEACGGMLLILSPDAVASKNVKDEVAYALEKEKRVVPVVVRQCQIPLRLRRVQHIDFIAAGEEAGLAQLREALSKREAEGALLEEHAAVREERRATREAHDARLQLAARPQRRSGILMGPGRAIAVALTPLLVLGLLGMWRWGPAGDYTKTLYIVVLAYGALAIGAMVYVIENSKSGLRQTSDQRASFSALLIAISCTWALAALALSYGREIEQFTTTASAIGSVLLFALLSLLLLRLKRGPWAVPFLTMSLVTGVVAGFFSLRLFAISGLVRKDLHYGVYHNVMSYGGLTLFAIVVIHALAYGFYRDSPPAGPQQGGVAAQMAAAERATRSMMLWLMALAGGVDGLVLLLASLGAFQETAFGWREGTFLLGGLGLLVAAAGGVYGSRFADRVAWAAVAVLGLGSLYAALFNVVHLGRLGLGLFEMMFLGILLLGIPICLAYVLTMRRSGL
ncbi:MAG TPA: toll/interleukin-1 receptor domain-containing protein [Candidatus Margulisiibacteriota bacterium]|nr:toll/interleukin-1 receptor domain-containing protein [Candidatus Margulisiibacteriota bacterium]